MCELGAAVLWRCSACGCILSSPTTAVQDGQVIDNYEMGNDTVSAHCAALHEGRAVVSLVTNYR